MLDLKMGYYTIRLDPIAQEYCTIVTPWGKYAYTRLPMGLCSAPDIFQQEMSHLMSKLEDIRTYLDDLLVLSTGSFQEHLQKLSTVLDKLKNAGLKVQMSKCKFCAPEVEYLGYLLTRNGIKPQLKKILAIQKLAVPRNVHEVRKLLGVIQYYRDMWPKRSHTLAPIAKLVSTKGLNNCQDPKKQTT